jgi:hypothetical protein
MSLALPNAGNSSKLALPGTLKRTSNSPTPEEEDAFEGDEDEDDGPKRRNKKKKTAAATEAPKADYRYMHEISQMVGLWLGMADQRCSCLAKCRIRYPRL